MQEVLDLMCDIVSAEYAQWMRYTYLSALGFGLNTDSLAQHFSKHSYDEQYHAATISRWIVDLGGLPPTEMPPVEQVAPDAESALQWLIGYEKSGIEKYETLLAMGPLPAGLVADVENILSTEYDHLSDLMKLCPEEDEGPTIIIMAGRKIQATSFKQFLEAIRPHLVRSGVTVPSALPKVIKTVVEQLVMKDFYPAYQKMQSKEAREKMKIKINQYIGYMHDIENADEDDWSWILDELKLSVPEADSEEALQNPSTFDEVTQWAKNWPLDPSQSTEEKEETPAAPAAQEESNQYQQLLDMMNKEKPKPKQEESRRPAVDKAVQPMIRDNKSKSPRPAEVGMNVYNQGLRTTGVIEGFDPNGKLIVKDSTGTTVRWDPSTTWISKNAEVRI